MFANKLDYISILGPTGTGKTRLAILLAESLPIEIISVDSVSVYQGLDIGSAKPTQKEQAIVPHHLIDICSLKEIYTVGRFVEESNILIKEIKSRGKMPLFCGGSIMYMKALMGNYHNLPTISDQVRQQTDALYQEKGVVGLYDILLAEDPAMARRVHPNDKQRICRALSVKRETGQSLMDYWGKNQDSQLSGFDFLLTVSDRSQHREVLADRVDFMIHQGLQGECQQILDRYGVDVVTHPAVRSIGYREMMLYLCENKPINEIRDMMISASSQFVKRQMTWLNSWPEGASRRFSLYDDYSKLSDIVDRIVESVNR